MAVLRLWLYARQSWKISFSTAGYGLWMIHVWQVCGNCLPGMSAGCFSAFCSEWDMSGRLVYKRLRVFQAG